MTATLSNEDVPNLPGGAAMMRSALLTEAHLDAEDEETARAEAAETAARAEADLAQEVGDDILEGEPPADIEADTTGLPPQRARLVRFNAWRDDMRAELDRMENGLKATLEAMGAPAETESKLQALIKADTEGLLSAFLGKRPALSEVEVHSRDRARLEAKLVDDRHHREVALAAYDAAVRAIALRRREIEVLDNRQRAFVVAAVREHAEALGTRYMQDIAALKRTLAELRGLGAVLGGNFDTSYTREIDVRLPTFQVPGIVGYRGETVVAYAPLGPSIKVNEREADDAAAPWRALATLWTQDPRAEPSPTLPVIDTTDESVPLPDEHPQHDEDHDAND